MTERDEEVLGELLRSLPAAPEAWVKAAQELPAARRAIDQLVALAERDQAFRRAALQDLEAAVRSAGYEPDRELLDELRGRL